MQDYLSLAGEIYRSRYPAAQFIIVAGSLIRGDGTESSDLDLVVVFDSLEAAYRESFLAEGVMVEAFVHDPATLKHFIHKFDYPDSMPVMANMIDEGVVIPHQTELSRQLKELAREHLAQGPAPASSEHLRNLRYSITNLLDDLKDSRNRCEQIATACRLYEELADLYFAVGRLWKGKAKSTVRVMNRHDPGFADRFCMAFDTLFRHGDISGVVQVTEEVLGPAGGYLFDGYRREADPGWRLE